MVVYGSYLSPYHSCSEDVGLYKELLQEEKEEEICLRTK